MLCCDIKEGELYCRIVIYLIAHSANWNGQTFLISGKFTYRQGVLYFREQSELHIMWNLWACDPKRLTFMRRALRSMKHCRLQPIKAAWEPAVALPCHWEWTVGLALIGREPESHLHLGQAALALNPHAPPFLPLGSSFARLPALLQRRPAEMSFTPTTDAQRRGWTHTHTTCSNMAKATKSTQTSPKYSLAEKKQDWIFHNLIPQIKAL